MKKILLSAAVAFACITAANAQSLTGSIQVHVTDYLTMTPSGSFGFSYSYANPTEMAAGSSTGAYGFTIGASRSWHVNAAASDWTRTEAAQPNVDQTVPVGDMLSLKADNGSAGVSTVGGFYPATTGGFNVANSNGGISKTFDMYANVNPTFAHNLSGTYTTNVVVIASLD